jgi:hypothetical protein
MKDDRKGWWDVPALDAWRCPACQKVSDVDLWAECSTECEQCGEHEARECPSCEERFDHVWGADRIAGANRRNP